MCNVNFVAEFNAFMRYAEENMLGKQERLMWIALFHAANKRAEWNEQTREFDWPEDFFPVSNDALHSNAGLDKRAVDDVRNRLKQRGMLDFMPGERNKRHAQYKLLYMTVGCKKAPNNAPREEPNNAPSSAPEAAPEAPQDGPSNAPNDAPSTAPDNKYKYYSKRDADYLQSINPKHLEMAKRDLNIFDDNWRYSERARAATAQQVVNAIVRNAHWGRMPEQTEGLYDIVMAGIDEHKLSPLALYLMATGSATKKRFIDRLIGAIPTG